MFVEAMWRERSISEGFTLDAKLVLMQCIEEPSAAVLGSGTFMSLGKSLK